MKEHNIRKLLDARVKAYMGTVRAVSWLGRKNAPDVLVLFPSWGMTTATSEHHVFVETKRPGKDATEAQAREHTRMRDAGCTVMVITNEAELDAWLPPL